MKRFVGIDLGTSNSTLAWVDVSDVSDESLGENKDQKLDAKILDIAQFISETEIAERPLLPSVLYAPSEEELKRSPINPFGQSFWRVGEYAKARQKESVGRSIHSAKSYLCEARIKKSEAFLPSLDAPFRLSPLEAIEKIVEHLHLTYDARFANTPLSDSDATHVTIAVPASFGEEARAFTLLAAKKAGIKAQLLEEPVASFYPWLQKNISLPRYPSETGEQKSQKVDPSFFSFEQKLSELGGRALVLVVDVGGGTTDLSLLELRSHPTFCCERVASGDHLLLGGDNIDFMLAALAEPRFSLAEKDGTKHSLEMSRWEQLRASCMQLKERLLSEQAPSQARVVLVGQSSQLFSDLRHVDITKNEVEALVEQHFFPPASTLTQEKQKRTALVSLGLSYERDTAITRHIAHFLMKHRELGTPAFLYLNGGFFKSPKLRELTFFRAKEICGSDLTLLMNPEPDLAVAKGAALHSAIHFLHESRKKTEQKKGTDFDVKKEGQRFPGMATDDEASLPIAITAGARRSYFVTSAGQDGKIYAHCILPRGAKSGQKYVLSSDQFLLKRGEAMRIEVFTYDTYRKHGQRFLVSELGPNESSFLTLETMAAGSGSVYVSLEAELSNDGSLNLYCKDEDGKTHPFLFPEIDLDKSQKRQLPAETARDKNGAFGKSTGVAQDFKFAAEMLSSRFENKDFRWEGAGTKKTSRDESALVLAAPDAPPNSRGKIKDLLRDLEVKLGEKKNWPLSGLRYMYDALIESRGSRRRDQDRERLFFWFLGYLLRPGWGYIGDPRRVAEAAKLFHSKLSFPDRPQAWQAFFIAYRRISAGLEEGVQVSMFDDMSPVFLFPHGASSTKKNKKDQLAQTELRTLLSCLEKIPPKKKATLGDALMERSYLDPSPLLLLDIGRLGARVPVYGSIQSVVSKEVVQEWLSQWCRQTWVDSRFIEPILSLARKTNDLARDISDRTRLDIEKKIITWFNSEMQMTITIGKNHSTAHIATKEKVLRALREHVETPKEQDSRLFLGEELPLGLTWIPSSNLDHL